MIKHCPQSYKVNFTLAIFMLIAPFMAQACFNSRNYSFFYAGLDRTCQNIRIDNFRREQLCPIPEVNANCPQTCGRCCVDDPDYKFKLKNKRKANKRGCAYLNSADRKDKYCSRWSRGRMIRDACPFACDFCQQAILARPPSPAPTREDPTAPTKAPSPNATPPPTKSPTKLPTSNPTKPPTNMPTASPTKSPTKAPTKPPTPSPTASPTKNPTASPTKSPTRSPTASPTKNPTTSPTKSPTASPSFSSASPTIECVNDQDFFVPNYPIKTCNWIGEKELRRGRNCNDRNVLLACPQVCGLCCKDEEDYSFITNQGTEKKCAWVAESEIRQRRYCESNTDNTGNRLLKTACPEACGYCFDPIN